VNLGRMTNPKILSVASQRRRRKGDNNHKSGRRAHRAGRQVLLIDLDLVTRQLALGIELAVAI
jgi:hypothetical protein